jgi:hypothetical protein
MQAWLEGQIWLDQRLELDLAAATQQRVIGAPKQVKRPAHGFVAKVHSYLLK